MARAGPRARPHVCLARGWGRRRRLRGARPATPRPFRGTWAVEVLARPLLRAARVASDVAPRPARVPVRVAAVTVVAHPWGDGEAGVSASGSPSSARPSPSALRPPPAQGARSLTRLRGCVQPVEAAQPGRRGGLVGSVQVALVLEAACGGEERPRTPQKSRS